MDRRFKLANVLSMVILYMIMLKFLFLGWGYTGGGNLSCYVQNCQET